MLRALVNHRRTTAVAAATSFISLQSMSSATVAQQDGAKKTFDLIVIGAGSGGIACAKRAASYGANVAIIEGKKYGGTCVNVGCVPKKIMFNASHVAEVIHEANHFAFKTKAKDYEFDWGAMKRYRDKYISRLNNIYEDGITKLNITRIAGYGSFSGPHTVKVGDEEYTAKHILIAVGGEPKPLGVPGDEHVIDSDGFFALEKQPKKVGVIGAGYIAVELAGVFNGLGSQTALFVRGKTALRSFDSMISTHLDASMKKAGINVVNSAVTERVTREADGTYTLHLKNGQSHSGFDCLLAATGRTPLTAPLALSKTDIACDEAGNIVVDEYQNTSVKGIYALGDVCGQVELTPMAIAAGRRLADRLFNNMPDAKADYDSVPTVVFSHPTIGTVGLTEEEAIKKYGKDNIKVYTSTFVNLWYGPFYEGGVGEKPFTKYKLIVTVPDEKVIGIHLIGMASDEVIQGFAVAMKMGATKADFDSCVAIHPTAAEELVTLPPWGMAPKPTRP